MSEPRLNAPYIRYTESNRTLMGDMMIALLPLYVMACYYYGLRALVLGVFSVAVCVGTDMLCQKLSGRAVNPRDLSAVVTGMLLPLMMPASIPYFILATAGVFAIAVAKHPFGGVGNNLFNPAASGYAFAALCWAEKMFSYPVPLEHLAVFGDTGAKLMQSPARTLLQGGVPNIDFLEMLLGNYPGPMGATHILVILACLLFLIYRKTINWQSPVCFLATAAVLAFCFPRLVTGNRVDSLMFELFSGILVFGAVFLLPEPVTSPKRISAKMLYGVFGAVIVMLYRLYGSMEEGMMFAILLLNAAAPVTDRIGEKLIRKVRRMHLGKLQP